MYRGQLPRRYVVSAAGLMTALMAVLLVIAVPVAVSAQSGKPASPSTVQPAPQLLSEPSGQLANQSALSVSPAISEQVLTPGTTTTFRLRVTNITRFPLPIKSSVRNLTPLEDLLPTADKATYDASAWFSQEPSDFILQPNQTKDVTVSVATPAKVTPGGHYATVYFQPLIPQEALSPSTAYLSAKVGVLIFMIAKGNIVEQIRLGSPQTAALHQFGPINLTVPVTNSGNVHMLPDGYVVIRNFRGKVIQTLPLKQGLVLPATIKNYHLSWDNKARIGYYSATAHLTYGTDKQVLVSRAVGFWIFPWLPIVTVVLVSGAVVWFVLKTRKRWAAAWRALRAKDSP